MSDPSVSPHEHHHPEHNAEEKTPFYQQPVVIGSIVFGGLFGIALWAYSQNTQWLEDTQENAQIEQVLAANPELSREDLEADVQAGDLSFWLRNDTTDNLTPLPPPNQEQDERPSLLDEYMKQQEKERQQAQKNNQNQAAPDPLLNLPNPLLLNNVANNEDSSTQGEKQNTRPPSALEMFLNSNASQTANTQANPLTQALDRLSRPAEETADGNAAAETDNPNSQTATGEANSSPLSENGENGLGLDNNNGQNPANALQPGMATTQPTNPYGRITPQTGQQTPNSGYSSLTPTPNSRRYPNAVTTPTPMVTPTDPRRPTVSPRFQRPSTNPYENSSLDNNNLTQPNYSRRQGATQRTTGGSTQPRNSQSLPRMGNGQINTFSDPLGAGN
ncbi:hypothetical protein PN462_18760 [Spirulina sp. CS-785/01]|uniref:hypothetical protein n=1 Tax=Spirulina sp. CS-785/01 TaxID=3021716 RepID=UPI00233130B1|nr:hypothetical protein [Spirulina sp. CS-785/01]MDB9315163.1 hypothetical protein [Spirulina sp. CS-785/01]